ncbi:hypothetical protein IJ182_05860 [bacterium]|nr:hypothetical protein [bacterium]
MKIPPLSFKSNYYRRNITAVETDFNNEKQLYPAIEKFNYTFGISFKGLSPQDNLINICKGMSYENYNASEENIKNGVFCIDLHSHSCHSDGQGNIPTILTQAAQYADDLYSKTGKKFTLALTDHDGVSGVKEALSYINTDKEKFKNLNFIPGAELSFAFISDGDIKNAEVLVYFLEPDSREVNSLINKLRIGRNDMIDGMIDALGDGYSRKDLDKYFMDGDETYAYNLHNRIRNYAQIKTRINKMSKEFKMPADKLYSDIMDRYVFRDGYRIQKPFTTPEGLDDFFNENGIYTNTKPIDEDVDEICKIFYPQIKNGQIVSSSENTLEHIIDVLGNNKNVLIGFAHPYFTAIQMQDYKKGFDELLKIGKGKIIFSENYHQSYPPKILEIDSNRKYIQGVNDYLSSKGLIAIGGRDSHAYNFINPSTYSR